MSYSSNNNSSSNLTRSSHYRVKGLVLKHRDMGESDRLVTVFTREHGKLTLSVRGARKTKTKLGGHLEPLVYGDYLIIRGRNLDSVIQGQIITPFKIIKNNLRKMAECIYLVDLVDHFLQDADPQPRILDLTLDALKQQDNLNSTGDLIIRSFEIKLLQETGFSPVLTSCADCGIDVNPIKNQKYPFSADSGGLLCLDCSRSHSNWLRSITGDTLLAMNYIQTVSVEKFAELTLGIELLSELESVSRWYISYVVDKPIEALVFLDQVRHSLE